ncbi:MAG TPA: XrtA/PEP-CTERM system histidine kinase PrsK [Candidatus Acidoferrum sp.]|nr:XrtA/PEP-CTERM system histidine kinase PrsK [Candidatus Acidoferrum sp.]
MGTPLPSVVTILAALTSVALAVGALARRPRGLLHWTFALGMVGFAAEALAAWILTQTMNPEARRSSLQTLEIARLMLVVPWAIFVVTLLHHGQPAIGRMARYGGFGWLAVLAVTTAAVIVAPAYEVSDVEAPFYAARLTASGQLSALAQLASMVGLLAALEATLRISHGLIRWRTKFLILGLGGALLVRFYFLSQTLLFNVVMASYLTAVTAAQFVANVAIAVSLVRDRLSTEFTVSRQLVYRSVAAGVLGVYLVAVGIVGWLLNFLGLSDAVVWSSLAIFITSLGLSTIMLSEKVRWKTKRFLTANFYRTKYDYRQQWITFTKRLGSLLSVEELAPELLRTVADAVGTTTAALYLDDPTRAGYRPICGIGFHRPVPPLAPDDSIVAALRESRGPMVVARSEVDGWPALPVDLGDTAVAVPMRRIESLIGFLIVGAERTGAAYTSEDLEFLSTVAEQASVTISTLRLSETLAQSREFEAFHRLTSFVIHDLKNSISALSMLSENALRHFDDPEFQRDAIKTLARTVDRMTDLLARLSRDPEHVTLTRQSVDVAALVLEATLPLLKDPHIAVVKDLAPMPPILGDPDALLCVIQNLLTNAIQSIRDEGTISLSTHQREGKTYITVADTGCGMSEDFIRTSLFAPFRSTKTHGWGIGLYQSKAIIEAHGGLIEVDSSPGRGSTFVITLPLTQAAQ